jgi:hypothetical protein
MSIRSANLKCREYVEDIQEYAEANTVKFYMAAERGAIEKYPVFSGDGDRQYFNVSCVQEVPLQGHGVWSFQGWSEPYPTRSKHLSQTTHREGTTHTHWDHWVF